MGYDGIKQLQIIPLMGSYILKIENHRLNDSTYILFQIHASYLNYQFYMRQYREMRTKEKGLWYLNQIFPACISPELCMLLVRHICGIH